MLLACFQNPEDPIDAAVFERIISAAFTSDPTERKEVISFEAFDKPLPRILEAPGIDAAAVLELIPAEPLPEDVARRRDGGAGPGGPRWWTDDWAFERLGDIYAMESARLNVLLLRMQDPLRPPALPPEAAALRRAEVPESWRHLSFPCGSWRLASWIDALTRRVRLFQEPGEAVDLRGLYVPGNVLSTWSHADDVLRLAQSPAYQPQDAPGWQPTRTRMQEMGLSRSNTSSSAARAKLERQLQREKERRLEAMPALTGACFEGVWVVGVSLDTAKLEEDDAAPLGVKVVMAEGAHDLPPLGLLSRTSSQIRGASEGCNLVPFRFLRAMFMRPRDPGWNIEGPAVELPIERWFRTRGVLCCLSVAPASSIGTKTHHLDPRKAKKRGHASDMIRAATYRLLEQLDNGEISITETE